MDDEELDFDTLPVEDYKSELLSYINKYQIFICIGETGSGKTTKIPQYCADSKFEGIEHPRVGITQPRRVAAMTVAQRVATERGCHIGEEVGYCIRFDDKTHPDKTRIKFMTDGVLVRECLSDPSLNKYDVIMLDEAHERSIHTDILFSLVKVACKERPSLKVIITSATLNSEKFSLYFNKCPIISIPGRVFPVDIYHSKNKHVVSLSGPVNKSYINSAIDLILKIHKEQDSGHILVFLTGQEDIEDACSQLRNKLSIYEETRNDSSKYELLVLPLYSSLPTEQQQKVFRQYDSHIRKCVIATNIAETSITVPNVLYVVDPGFVKQKAYDPSRRMETLVTVPISQVAAQQRAGRAGRTGAGCCYRLYSSDCCKDFMNETIPEIKRSNLTNVVLYLKVLGIHNVLDFDFLDTPSEEQLEDALCCLHTLGALDGSGNVTPLGKKMSNFAVDPYLSKFLVFAIDQEDSKCLPTIATICAMLSVEDIWWTENSKSSDPRAQKRREMITEAHNNLNTSWGDHLTYFNVFSKWVHEGKESKAWCEDNFIKFRALRTAKQIREQLLQDAKKIKPTLSNEIVQKLTTQDKMLVLKALASGLFMNAGRRCGNDNMYRSLSLKDQNVMLFHLHPTCALKDQTQNAEYVVYHELVSSSKIYMRHVSPISFEFLQSLRKSYVYVSPFVLSGKLINPVNLLKNEQDTNILDKSESNIEKPSNLGSLQSNDISSADTSSVSNKNSADLARQRYLERKRKLG